MKTIEIFLDFYGLTMFFQTNLKLFVIDLHASFSVLPVHHLLNQTIRKHVDNYKFDIDFVQKVIDSFYVDDFTGGADNFEKALELYKKLNTSIYGGVI